MKVACEEPRLIERMCGGWLAVSPRGSSLKIGVMGDTEDAARGAFAAAIQQWRTILNKRTV